MKTELRTGDIIFQSSKTTQAQAIQLATDFKYNHLGIVFEKNNKLFVYEAISTVRYTPVKEWIEKGVDSVFKVKRLKNAEKMLDNKAVELLGAVSEEFHGKEYDEHAGANDDKIYCSELVWKIFKRSLNIELGEYKKMSDVNLSNKIVSDKLKERFNGVIPYDISFILPISIYHSEELMSLN